MIIIFTFNREKALSRLLDELEGKDDILVLDDGSTYPQTPFVQRCNYKRSQHGGRKGFWKQWHQAFTYCKFSDDDRFVFLADDWENVQWEAIQDIFNRLEGKFAVNVTNVGWQRSWTPIRKQPSGYEGLYRVGWIDHGMITNRKTLEALQWKMHQVSDWHFENRGSSGTGKQISKRLFDLGIPMYTPFSSLAEHQGCPSVMHPERQIELKPQ